MPRRTILFFYIFLVITSSAPGQIRDSVKQESLLIKSITPAVLMGSGLLLSGSQPEKNLQVHLRGLVGDDFQSDVDDYLQYAPIAQLYIADLAGLRSRNHWFDQTKYLLISNLITSALTHGLKNLTMKARPNRAPYAFPSGHTSFAFNNAAVLYQEFNQSSPLLAYSGFAFATTTGVYRMLNNKHWLSDVFFGAGLGILVVELVYHFEPLKAFNPFKESNSVSIIPEITEHRFGIYLTYAF